MCGGKSYAFSRGQNTPQFLGLGHCSRNIVMEWMDVMNIQKLMGAFQNDVGRDFMSIFVWNKMNIDVPSDIVFKSSIISPLRNGKSMGVRRIFSRRGQNPDSRGGESNFYIVYAQFSNSRGGQNLINTPYFINFPSIFPSQGCANATKIRSSSPLYTKILFRQSLEDILKRIYIYIYIYIYIHKILEKFKISFFINF